MDFFDRQDNARKNTGKLVLLYTLAVVGVVLSMNAVGLVLFVAGHSADKNKPSAAVTFDPAIFVLITIGTLVLIGLCMLYKIASLGGDGGKLAEELGGQLVSPQSTSEQDRRILNVVEEMAIASGVPVPRVYMLPDETINAFAAGLRPDNAVIGVTRGCVQQLSRDELQGVVAHEFSHILNGDMRLNLRLIGWNFGIMAVGIVGYYVLRFAPRQTSRSSKDGAGAVLAIFAFGIAMMIIGYVGFFFGQLIQAAVSRQREFLADASAVQFTRNPGGIGGALKKIGQLTSNAEKSGSPISGSAIANSHAAEASHLFFARPVGGFLANLMATHPPIIDRIKAIDASFAASLDPQSIQSAPQPRERAYGDVAVGFDQPGFSATSRASSSERVSEPKVQKRPRQLVESAGTTGPSMIARSQDLLGALPAVLQNAARDAYTARAAVLSLVVGKDAMLAQTQLQLVSDIDPPTAQLMAEYLSVTQQLQASLRLPLLDLCTPALRSMSPTQLNDFRRMARAVGEADRILTPFELALYKTIDHQLLREANHPSEVRLSSMSQVRKPAGVLLAALAERCDFDTAEAYESGLRVLSAGEMPVRRTTTDLRELGQALSLLRHASPPLKRRVIEAAAAVVACDNQLNVEEAELLRATCAALDVPLPPIVME